MQDRRPEANSNSGEKYSSALSTLCKRLRRDNQNISQTDFAAKADIDSKAVERFEDPSHGKTLTRIIQIASGFGLTPSQLLAEAEQLIETLEYQPPKGETDSQLGLKFEKETTTLYSESDLDEFIEDERSKLAHLLKLAEEPKINPDSDLVDLRFAKHFQMSLLLHHAHSAQPLIKQLFEHKFLEACKARNWEGFIESSPVNPGRDIHSNNTDWSLKTEAAKSSSKNKIKISKFCEARWIRECLEPKDFLQGISDHILPHLDRYDRIVLLKVTEPTEGMISYALYEIKTDLLRLMANIQITDISRRSVNGSASSPVFLNGERAFSLRFDGSVEKITIEQINTKLCQLHCKWIVPKNSQN